MKRSAVIAALAALLLLAGCGEMPAYRFGNKPGDIVWSGKAAAKGLSSTSMSPPRAAQAPIDPSFQPYTDYYASLGAKKGSYTPTKFQLFIWMILIWDDYDHQVLSPAWTKDTGTDGSRIVDFANGINSTFLVRPGWYKGLVFDFFSWSGIINTRYGPPGQEKPIVFPYEVKVEVSIPGYESAWQDVQSMRSGPQIWSRKYLGNGRYSFEPEYLMPVRTLFSFLYRTDYTYRAVLPGKPGSPAIFSYQDPVYAGIPNYFAGSSSSILIPYKGFNVPVTAKGVRLVASWDLTDLIEVYEGPTTALDDDIAVLANNFWERLSLVPSVIY
jgi:hypothetical protein